MNNETLFISDLHISLDKPEITRSFLWFLENRASKAQSLYILGDLFDAWVGDDDYTPPTNKIRKQLKKLTDAGTRLYFQPGNRDFLLGQRFCRETGMTLLGDYQLIDLNGVPTLLTHGDLLCSDDVAYQQFRVKSRSREWQQHVLSKPLLLRLLMARWYRFRSHFHKRNKTPDIMDVNQQTVLEIMRQFGALRLIHGHTHRPRVHQLDINGQPAQRFVLPDWKKDSAGVLCWHADGYTIETIEDKP